MELCIVTKFLMDRGARLTATLRSTYYHRSPLMQGGLKIPCAIVVYMSSTQLNSRLITRYKELVENLYLEPPDDGDHVVGSFGQTGEIIDFEISLLTKRCKCKNTKKSNQSIQKNRLLSKTSGVVLAAQPL